VEFALLLPEHAASYLPWRQVADDIADGISRDDQGPPPKTAGEDTP
jgi:hypothetical protein